MNRIGVAALSFLILCTGCGSGGSDISGQAAGLTGFQALASVNGFNIQDENPVFEWNANSADKLDFAIQACDGSRCLPFYTISCVDHPECLVKENWKSGEGYFDHRLITHFDNGSRSYRLEICDTDRLALRPEVVISIQARSKIGEGNWVVAKMTTLPMKGFCRNP